MAKYYVASLAWVSPSSVRRNGRVDDVSDLANRTALARFVQGGVIPVRTNAVLSEVHRTWNRPEAAKIGELYAHVSPNYAAVVESYKKAQEVVPEQTPQARPTGAQ